MKIKNLLSFSIVVLWTLPLLIGCDSSPSDTSAPSYPSRYILNVTSQPDHLPADGLSQSTIRAYVTTEFGDPVSNILLYASTTLGTFEGSTGSGRNAELTTDESGYAYVFLKAASTVGTTQITVSHENAHATVMVNFI